MQESLSVKWEGGGGVLLRPCMVERRARNAQIPVPIYELEVVARAAGVITGPRVRGRRDGFTIWNIDLYLFC